MSLRPPVRCGRQLERRGFTLRRAGPVPGPRTRGTGARVRAAAERDGHRARPHHVGHLLVGPSQCACRVRPRVMCLICLSSPTVWAPSGTGWERAGGEVPRGAGCNPLLTPRGAILAPYGDVRAGRCGELHVASSGIGHERTGAPRAGRRRCPAEGPAAARWAGPLPGRPVGAVRRSPPRHRAAVVGRPVSRCDRSRAGPRQLWRHVTSSWCDGRPAVVPLYGRPARGPVGSAPRRYGNRSVVLRDGTGVSPCRRRKVYAAETSAMW